MDKQVGILEIWIMMWTSYVVFNYNFFIHHFHKKIIELAVAMFNVDMINVGNDQTTLVTVLVKGSSTIS